MSASNASRPDNHLTLAYRVPPPPRPPLPPSKGFIEKFKDFFSNFFKESVNSSHPSLLPPNPTLSNNKTTGQVIYLSKASSDHDASSSSDDTFSSSSDDTSSSSLFFPEVGSSQPPPLLPTITIASTSELSPEVIKVINFITKVYGIDGIISKSENYTSIVDIAEDLLSGKISNIKVNKKVTWEATRIFKLKNRTIEGEGYQYYYGKKIGFGNFSKLYRAINFENDKDVIAVKKARKKRDPNIRSNKPLNDLKKENAIIKLLNPNGDVVGLIDPSKMDSIEGNFDAQTLYDGDLSKITKELEGMPLRTKLELFRQLVLGAMTLHSNSYVHGDIKPENCLYKKGPDGRVEKFVLADLAGGKYVYEHNEPVTFSRLYAPPNFNPNNTHSTASMFERMDSYALVLTMVQGLLGLDSDVIRENIWEDDDFGSISSNHGLLENLKSLGIKPDSNLYKIILNCLYARRVDRKIEEIHSLGMLEAALSEEIAMLI